MPSVISHKVRYTFLACYPVPGWVHPADMRFTPYHLLVSRVLIKLKE